MYSNNNGLGTGPTVVDFNAKVDGAMQEYKQRREQQFLTHTLPNGVTLRLKPVPPYLLDKVRQAIPAPQPPVQIVDGVEHINTAHPDYKEAVKAHAREVADKTSRVMLELGCELDVTPAEMEAELAAIEDIMTDIDPRLTIANAEGQKLSLKYRYLIYAGLGRAEDIEKVIAKITGMTEPTGQEVQANLDAFRG